MADNLDSFVVGGMMPLMATPIPHHVAKAIDDAGRRARTAALPNFIVKAPRRNTGRGQ